MFLNILTAILKLINHDINSVEYYIKKREILRKDN